MATKPFKITIQLIGYLLLANTLFAYTRQDSLRGSNGRGRDWWDVQHYNLFVEFDTSNQSITGQNTITALVNKTPSDSLQLDLQDEMILDSAVLNGINLPIVKDGNVWWIKHLFKNRSVSSQFEFTAYYHGKPRRAKSPPWDGGFIWAKDSTGKPWLSVACQGLGASSWWPCKDYQADEPDSGMSITISFPDNALVTSNGPDLAFPVDNSGKINIEHLPKFNQEYAVWGTRVKNPINTYNATFYIGDYVSWTDTLMGEKGVLDLSFYCLRYNEAKAREHFKEAKAMLHCFEYWMGPYPFYEDGYKLVEAPFLGMEHQSAIAYGNEYKNGYRGKDRSGTGVGDLFDFIIIHESGHEWYGNNITAADIADNWIHEGFTTYTEALYAEWIAGKEKAFDYTRGEWSNIRNDKPVIGTYGVHDDGSSDKYDKGSAVVHMIRMMMNDDYKFRRLLREMNKVYYHKTVTSAEIEQFIMDKTGLALKPFFDQYLRTKEIPVFDYYIKKGRLYYRFTNVVDGFTLPLQVTDDEKTEDIKPTTQWQHINWKNGGYNVSISRDFLVRLKP